MKIITYSDLHLELGTSFKPPNQEVDVMILAGDIITFQDYEPLNCLLDGWKKPVIFVAGNHEFYMNTSMEGTAEKFKSWLQENYPNVQFLQDEAITISGVHFFGGTMWTDFQQSSEKIMLEAIARMDDFKLIKGRKGVTLTPHYTTKLHDIFVQKLIAWFKADMAGKRVVVTHHAPVINPGTKYAECSLMPAFYSTDMIHIIKEYQPNLWIYGHTHECDDRLVGQSRIISNQMGHTNSQGEHECKDFDPAGKLVVL